MKYMMYLFFVAIYVRTHVAIDRDRGEGFIKLRRDETRANQ